MLIADSDRAASTKDQYTRALAPYLDAGGNMTDVAALAAYADTLCNSRRSHLRSAVKIWAASTQKMLKAADTPETHTKTAAALNRLDVLADVITVKATKGRKAHTWLSEKQIVELERTCGDDITGLRDSVVLGLLVGCGLRRQELANLEWSDLVRQPMDGEICTVVSVRGKGDKDRVVPLTAELDNLLSRWAEWTGRDGYIVRSLGMDQRVGDSLDASSIFRIVRKHGAAIGLPELAAHDLRRSFAQTVWNATHDLLLVRDLMGHSSIATTQRYLELDQTKKRDAVSAVPWGRR